MSIFSSRFSVLADDTGLMGHVWISEKRCQSQFFFFFEVRQCVKAIHNDVDVKELTVYANFFFERSFYAIQLN